MQYKALLLASMFALGTAAMATQANAESNISGGENLGPPLSDFWPELQTQPGARARASTVITHRRTVMHHPTVVHHPLKSKAPVTDKSSG